MSKAAPDTEKLRRPTDLDAVKLSEVDAAAVAAARDRLYLALDDVDEAACALNASRARAEEARAAFDLVRKVALRHLGLSGADRYYVDASEDEPKIRRLSVEDVKAQAGQR